MSTTTAVSRRRAIALTVAKRIEDPSRPGLPASLPAPAFVDHDNGLSIRQNIRRMIDIKVLGMVGSHEASKEGVRSLKTLRTIAGNIIEDPDDASKRRININSSIAKRDILHPDAKGVLDLIIEMGFKKEKVIEFKAYRVFVGDNLEHLKLCAHLIEEAIGREQDRIDEKLEEARKREEKEDIWHHTMLHVKEDRKQVKQRVEREKAVSLSRRMERLKV